MNRYTLSFLLACLVSMTLIAQEQDTLSSVMPKDEKSKVFEGGVFEMFQGSPGKSALYSLVVPGGGQFRNKRYWKIPIVLGAEGFAIYNIITNTKNFKNWDQGYKGLISGDIASIGGISDIAQVGRIRDGYRKNRDFSYLALAIVHIVSVADAFVDRHLIEFDIDEDISLQLFPPQSVLGFSMVFEF